MELQVNGKAVLVQADPDTPLLWVIRDDLGLTGTKYGCGLAQCGACAVMIDGVAVRSCVTPVERAVGKAITTIEAIEQDPVGKRVVEAWVAHQVPQCGYCQSGQVMAATSLLKQVARPSEAQIAASMVNLCRCGTYNQISAAMHDVAGLAAAAPGGSAAAAGTGVGTALGTTLGAGTAAIATVIAAAGVGIVDLGGDESAANALPEELS